MYNTETKQWEGYIYAIANDFNDKLYIGQTQRNVEMRFQDHIKASKKGRIDVPFDRIIKLHGFEHFYCYRIERVVSITKQNLQDLLDIRETYWVIKKMSLMPNGYNCNIPDKNKVRIIKHYDYDGNLLSIFPTLAEASRKTGVTRASIRGNCSGKSKSTTNGIFRFIDDEFDKYPVRKYIKKDRKLRKDCRFHKPIEHFYIDKYTVNGEFVKRYSTLKEAAKEEKYSYTWFTHTVKWHDCSDGEYVYFKSTEKFDYSKIKFMSKNKSCEMYDLNNNYITTFKSRTDAARYIGCNPSCISACCCNITHSSHGYIFKDKDI